jgi:hypothetical protein
VEISLDLVKEAIFYSQLTWAEIQSLVLSFFVISDH